jgi:hypothetical protein
LATSSYEQEKNISHLFWAANLSLAFFILLLEILYTVHL